VIVNAVGEVVSRRDCMPFGEEKDPDGTYRTTNRKYGAADSVRQKFTGYQKDEETGLDFAEARMYQNLHGRFTAIDPLLASGKSANPQTFNRYVYVMNSPLILNDPNGMQAGIPLYPAPKCVSGCWGNSDGNGLMTANNPLASVESERAEMSQVEALVSGFHQSFEHTKSGSAKGAANAGIGALNVLTNPLGLVGTAAGVPNPVAIEKYSYDSPTEETWGTGFDVGLTVSTGVAGAPFSAGSSLTITGIEAPVFRFSQLIASENFSRAGTFSGRSVASVADDLRNAVISPSDVPVGFVTRGNVNLIENTRSYLALQQSGIPRTQWSFLNQTENAGSQANITKRLARNGLTDQGTSSLTTGQCQFFCN
jgi:RHS repeat-associated protein